MDAKKRRNGLVALIKQIYARRADELKCNITGMEDSVKELLLLAFPLNGKSKNETKSAGSWYKNIHVFFNHYHINLDEGDSFTEYEIYSAEIGAVMTIHGHFTDVYNANDWLADAYKFTFYPTCFGNVYHAKEREPPQIKRAERLMRRADAIRYLNVDESEFEKVVADWDLVIYRHKDNANDVAFDADEIKRIKDVWDDEDDSTQFALTGDAEIDEKIIYAAITFGMISESDLRSLTNATRRN